MARASEILVRRIDFEFPDDMDLVFIEDDPRLSYYFLGAWMLLPHLEPFLIRTVQAAMPRVSDAALLEDMKRFCAQEGQHFRQHAKANEVVRRVHPAGERLAALEAEAEALFRRWSAEKPLRFNLAYAEAFESMTAAGSILQMEQGWFDDMKEPIRSLMLWHIMEEVEHRSVCFDAHRAAGGGYLYRVAVGAWAQAHYLGLCQRLAQVMIEADPETVSRHDTPAAAAKRKARLKAYARGLWPRQLAAVLPWHSPGRVRLPPQFEPARRHFSEIAQSVQ